MIRSFITCFFIGAVLLVPAQFGPIQFAFGSDAKYPMRIMAGDVDGDGDLDPVIYNEGTGNIYTRGLYCFPNLGGGQFASRQTMFIGSIGNASVTLMRDMDDDGDADLVADDSWYVNDGTGALTLVGNYVTAGTAAGLLEDLDGDGDVDDLVRDANGVSLLLNNGAGIFSMGAGIGPVGTNSSLAASRADLNNDNLPDLVIGGNNTQTGWYANLGGGLYGPQQAITDLISPATPFCADVDGDGDKDVIGFGLPGGTVWFANDGMGTFTLGDTIPIGVPKAIADFDGDGDVDLTVTTGTTCNVQLLQNQGGLSWINISVETVSGYNLVGTSYAPADLDGDGDEDLLACSGMDLAAWYPNLGNGSIGLRERFCQTMAGAYDISASDIDLDGDQDLVTASYYGDWVCWYANSGNGTFSRQNVIVEHKNQVSASRTADLNGDGLSDIVTNVGSCAIIWNNNGGSSWTPDTLPGAGVSRCEVDLDGDGDLDLVGSAKWYENDGSGLFTTHAEPQLVAGTVRAGDMTGDGVVDLVISGSTVLVNDGAGSFTTVANGTGQSLFGLADLDADGDQDVLGIRQWGGAILLDGHFNDGSGSLSTLNLFTGPTGMPRTILVKDINGDGYPDAVWALSNGYTHQTYYNLNIGNGQFGPANLIDPTAESAGAMAFADLNNDAVEDLVTARFRTISWQENEFFNAFRLRGSVFLDFDLDVALDTSDHKIPYRLVRTDANNILVWTNSAGDYDLPADTGTWSVWHAPPSMYQVTNDPDTLTATLTTPSPIEEGLDIGLAPALQDSSSFLSITYSGPFRCNTDVVVWINLRNTGTFIPEGVVIEYDVHPDMLVSSVWPTPDSVVANQFYWHVDSLGWFQQFAAQLVIHVGPAGSLRGTGYMVTAANMPLLYDQPFVASVVSCAMDPNDKLVTPQGYGTAGAVDIDTEWLEYTVRFQNTGTDTAFTVQLLDSLDMDLDPLSMEVLDASHALTQILVDANNLALFRFERILLPDSNVNEAASHGFVKYRIKPNAGSPHLTEITNAAAIYFDLNAPVITNTTLNTLVDCNAFDATIGPFDVDILQASVGVSYQWYQDGSPIPGANSQQLVVTGSGSYSVVVVNAYGCALMSDELQVVITNVGDIPELHIALIPNPVHEHANLILSERLSETARVEVVDAMGKVLRTMAGNGSRSITIDRRRLPGGVYLLRVIDADRVIASHRMMLD